MLFTRSMRFALTALMHICECGQSLTEQTAMPLGTDLKLVQRDNAITIVMRFSTLIPNLMIHRQFARDGDDALKSRVFRGQFRRGK